jgi:6-phosphogluconolactonase
MSAQTARQVKIGRAEISIFSDSSELYRSAGDEVFRVIMEALDQRHICQIALAGGSTPKPLYSLVAARAAKASQFKNVDWKQVHFFFADERAVPPDHPDSNYLMVSESLLKNALVPSKNVHRIRTELPPEEAARQYERELESAFNSVVPSFDLILLGMGADGHTASLFPGSAALDITNRLVVENWAAQLGMSRITMTYPVLNNAREVLFLVNGAEKSGALARVFRDSNPPPAARVQPQGRLLWFVDSAAATGLLSSQN